MPFCIHHSFPSTCKTNNAYTLIQTMTVQRAAPNFEHGCTVPTIMTITWLTAVIRRHYCKMLPNCKDTKMYILELMKYSIHISGCYQKKLVILSVSSFAYSLNCSSFIKLCPYCLLSLPFLLGPCQLLKGLLLCHSFAPDTVFFYLLGILISQTVCEPNWIPFLLNLFILLCSLSQLMVSSSNNYTN